jgi:hypothetical protein
MFFWEEIGMTDVLAFGEVLWDVIDGDAHIGGAHSFKLVSAAGGVSGDLPSLDRELVDAGLSVALRNGGKDLFLMKGGFVITVR